MAPIGDPSAPAKRAAPTERPERSSGPSHGQLLLQTCQSRSAPGSAATRSTSSAFSYHKSTSRWARIAPRLHGVLDPIGLVPGLQPEDPLGITKVNPLKYRAGQAQPVNVPAPLPGATIGEPVRKVVIIGFQESVVEAIPLRVWRIVHAKKDAIRVAKEKPTGGVGLASQLGYPRANIHVVVWQAIQHSSHVGQVFGVAALVSSDEGRARVAVDHLLQCLNQTVKGRKPRVGEVPAGH